MVTRPGKKALGCLRVTQNSRGYAAFCGTTGFLVTQTSSPCCQVPSLAYFRQRSAVGRQAIAQEAYTVAMNHTILNQEKQKHTQNMCYFECNLIRNCCWVHGIWFEPPLYCAEETGNLQRVREPLGDNGTQAATISDLGRRVIWLQIMSRHSLDGEDG